MQRAALREELIVHYIAGHWRAPLGTRALALGGGLGHIACAGAPDALRALAGLRPGALDRDGLDRDWAELRGRLHERRRAEGIAERPRTLSAPPLPALAGPAVLLTSAQTPMADILSVLATGQGVIWKPAPGAASSAHALVDALKARLGAAVAMVQGDHASGRVLAGLGVPVLWLSPDPAPSRDWHDLNRAARG